MHPPDYPAILPSTKPANPPENPWFGGGELAGVEAKRVNYRKLAFAHYDPLCAHCGFGVPAVLEVAHIDGNRQNNTVANLVILCPNCHEMHDLDLISTATIVEMRDRPKVVVWAKRMKDAGQKAALTRLRRAAGRKAAATRKLRALVAQGNGQLPDAAPGT